ncbi:MAG: hypothetical protein AB7I04_00285 [Pseudomonadales bacterium]
MDIEVSAPLDQEWLSKIADVGGVHKAIGYLWIRAESEPQTYQSDEGESFEIEPIRVGLNVSLDAFNVILGQINESESRQRITRLRITISGDLLPEPEDRLNWIRPKHLNLSESSSYPITGFDVVETRYLDSSQGRLNPSFSLKDGLHTTDLTFTLTSSEVEIDGQSGQAISLKCEADLRPTSILRAYQSRDLPPPLVDIRFELSSPKDAGDASVASALGEFHFYPGASGDTAAKAPGFYRLDQTLPTKGSAGSFEVKLYFVAGDEWRFLIPFLSIQGQRSVEVEMVLVSEYPNLLEAESQVQGTIRYYALRSKSRPKV